MFHHCNRKLDLRVPQFLLDIVPVHAVRHACRMTAAAAAVTLLLTCGSGGALWALAVLILEISCGVSLVLHKHVETPYRTGGSGSAVDLIGVLRHIFVLVPLTVFLAYAAWIVEGAAILSASALVGAYYTIMQYICPQASVVACTVLALCVFASYDAYFKRQFLNRVRQLLHL